MAARWKEYLWLAIVGSILIAALLIVRSHADSMEAFIDEHPAQGAVLYFVLNILDAVLVPGATLPLIPVAVRVWGHVSAALVTIAGWTAGSLIAFLIARQWGSPIVRKFVPMERLRSMKRYIPEDLFWSVALLRLVLPMDVISYVLGLFTDISWSKYAGATALGLIPSAFALAYLGKLPAAYDILAVVIGIGVVAAYVMIGRRRYRRSAG
jgi:uncharacterized membrane protein YdjX (TVP38/TMEM64 family)